MNSFITHELEQIEDYKTLLSIMGSLSGLFSANETPYLHYRVAEKIFCKCFKAKDLSRADVAYDAQIGSIGIGLKTFICDSDCSTEKVAEFNALSSELSKYSGLDLAREIAKFRNERIDFANRLYNIDNGLYHIVARNKQKEFILFETDYNKIDLETLSLLSTRSKKGASLHFQDQYNRYSFNFSKSTLFRSFDIPQNALKFPIEILDDPYELLLDLFQNRLSLEKFQEENEETIILPLYGRGRKVYEKSGLNQWNAGGRKRDFGEVYIPIPSDIHKLIPSFFPSRDCLFQLEVPTGEVFFAKLCQEGGKALMTNPNKALSDWLLRKVFKLKEGELLNIDRMDAMGFDSVSISKIQENYYKIDKARSGSYEDFLKKLSSKKDNS